MQIKTVTEKDKIFWNKFVRENYPPVGSFMMSWEWGEFKENYGRPVKRYFVMDSGRMISALTIVEYSLPFGFFHGYAPRGPVVVKDLNSEQILKVLEFIRQWVYREFPHLFFLRLEPPMESLDIDFKEHKLIIPRYYIQPRHNHAIFIDKTKEELLASFHSTTRSNLNRAERRGVKVEVKDHTSLDCYSDFINLAKDTISRNSGKNVYPQRKYYESMFMSIPAYLGKHEPERLQLVTFYGYQDDKLAAIHLVLFFGDTATYLYGASSTECLRSKVTTYLHWQAMLEAKKHGIKYYDLGGVDEKLWPSLTNFKRQFRGEEFSYLGNIDIPINYKLYRLYNLARIFLKK